MKIKKILLAAIIIALPIFAWYLFLYRDAVDTLLSGLEQPGVISAFLLSSLILLGAHVIRALKTKLLVDSIKITPLRTHIRALFVGYLFNTLLPFRVGEIIRAFVLGKGTKMSSTFMFGLVLFDRALDGLFLGCLSFLLLFSTNVFDGSDRLHNIVLVASILLVTVSVLVLSLLITIRLQPKKLLLFWHRFTKLFNHELRDSLRFKMWSLIYGLERVLILRKLVRYVLLTLAMWCAYLAAMTPLAITMLSDSTPTQLVATSDISYLGVSAPSGPSHIGSYQAFVQPYIDAQGAQQQAYRQLLALTWLLQILPAFLVGLVFVLRTQETLTTPKRKAGTKITEDKLLRNVDISKDLSSFLDAFFSNNSLSHIMHRLEVDKDSRLVHYFKGGSSAITALVHEKDNLVVRKITPIQYKYKLESQYKWLKDKKKLKKVVNVLNEETTESYYKIDLEYNDEYIPFFDYIHSMPAKNSKKILANVFDYMFKEVYKPKPKKYLPDDLNAYIKNRCLNKIKQSAEVNDEIRGLLSHDKLLINGKEYVNIPTIIEEIKKDKKISQTLSTYRKCSIHGDTTVDNILASKKSNDFLLIDPTDNENEISGPVFDFGRMTQSLRYGYEFLARDDRKVEIINNQINFEYSFSSNYAELEKDLLRLEKKYLTSEEQTAVLFHAAVLYSRMLTHRVVINPLNAAKFYAVSVIAFNDFMKKVKK